MLDGEIVAHVDDAQHRVGAGGLFFAPRGVPHAFMVASETAHILGVQTPGSGESFYREAGEPATSEEESRRPADWARLRAVAERSNCIEILGRPVSQPSGPSTRRGHPPTTASRKYQASDARLARRSLLGTPDFLHIVDRAV